MLLGIDQGTTGTRACLVDGGRIVRHAYAPHTQLHPRDGWVEHDVDEIWACTQRVIDEVGVRPSAVAIANQGETVVIWDAETRRPLHHALVWQDTRTAEAVARLAADTGIARRVLDETGLGLDPYFSAAKLRWLLDHVPGARELAERGRLRAGTLDTWLIDRLTDGRVFATDASTAARTQLCDTRTLAWSPFLLELFAIPPQVLPEIRASDGGFGVCAGGLLDGVPIVASLVDQPAALAGQGCIDRGDAKATFGTGCFIYVNTGAERPSGAHGTLATVAWRARGQTCYSLDGGVLAFGSALDWLTELGLGDRGALEAALAAPRGRHVVCVPALVGLGAPHWQRHARGAWLGLSHATTRDDLAGALAEGLACRVVEVVHAVERDAGMTIRELRVDGGWSRSPALMQLHADLLGCPIDIAEQDEATALGACSLAALALGELTDDELRARKTRARARYEPRMSADEREHALVRFARARELTAQWQA
jgi:glycerol kinase